MKVVPLAIAERERPIQSFRAADPELPESWRPYWKSFARALRATTPPRSERTIKAYAYALQDLARWYGRRAPALEQVARADLEDFFAAFNLKHDADYAAIHYRGLRRWFNWLVEEGDLATSPMKRIPAPKVPDEPTQVLDLETIGKLLKACAGAGFEERRDTALVRFLLDTGVRLEGVTRLRLEDVDLDRQEAIVVGKGGHRYIADLGAKAVRDLDRYLRMRQQHRHRDSAYLWLGQDGALTPSGIYQLVRRRARRAGLHFDKAVHVFRHSFSHHFRAAGGQQDDLKVLGGWKSDQMVQRYGRSLAAERARAAHRRYSPGDQI